MQTDVLSEHEPINSDSSGSSLEMYNPTQEEEALVKKVDKLFDAAKEYRAKYDGNWIEYYRLFRGKNWTQARPSYRNSEVINMIWKTIQSQVPLMTDRQPQITYLPQGPEDIELADILSKIADQEWRSKNWSKTLLEVIYDGSIYCNGHAELGFDPNACGGVGEIFFKSEDIFHIYPCPDSKDVNEDFREFHIAEPLSLKEIRRRWPTNGKYVKPDIDEEPNDKENFNKQIYMRNLPSDWGVINGEKKPSSSKRALVITTYWYPEDTDEESKTETGADGIPKVTFIQKRKWPNGRKTVRANNVILYDGPNPYDDGKIPYQKFDNYFLPHEYWGQGDIENLKSPQKILDKIVNFILDVLIMTGNPIWILDSNSGVDGDNLFNRPGEIVVKNPGTDVHREMGTQLQPYVMNMLEYAQQWVRDVSGDTEVSSGVRPEGVNSGYAISQLMEASKTRLRQKSKNLDMMLQQVGQQFLSRIQQFWSIPQVIRLTNDQNVNGMEFFKFHVVNEPQNDGTVKRIAKVQKITQTPEQTQISPEQSYSFDGKFDVKVSTGSLLPFSRVENENKLLQYYDRGIIDREEVLKGSAYPNYEQVLARMNEKDQAKAQAQAQAQQAH